MDSRDRVNQQFFEKIKTNNIGQKFGLLLEIDTFDERIRINNLTETSENENKSFLDSLPNSLNTFIRFISNGINIDIGNLVRVDSIDGTKSMKFWTNEYLNYDSFPTEKFIAFGSSGAGEVFGFLTDIETNSSELPVVWMDVGSYDKDGFVFINSSFDKFLTIQYYLLKANDNEDLYIELEDEEIEKTGIELEDDEWQSFQDFLYDRFDPFIPKPKSDLFKSAKTLTEVITDIEKYKITIANNSYK